MAKTGKQLLTCRELPWASSQRVHRACKLTSMSTSAASSGLSFGFPAEPTKTVCKVGTREGHNCLCLSSYSWCRLKFGCDLVCKQGPPFHVGGIKKAGTLNPCRGGVKSVWRLHPLSVMGILGSDLALSSFFFSALTLGLGMASS